MRDPKAPIRISLYAPDGRMGIALRDAIDADPDFLWDQDQGDVLIDFSSSEVTTLIELLTRLLGAIETELANEPQKARSAR